LKEYTIINELVLPTPVSIIPPGLHIHIYHLGKNNHRWWLQIRDIVSPHQYKNTASKDFAVWVRNPVYKNKKLYFLLDSFGLLDKETNAYWFSIIATFDNGSVVTRGYYATRRNITLRSIHLL
jgi:hypothetical protein